MKIIHGVGLLAALGIFAVAWVMSGPEPDADAPVPITSQATSSAMATPLEQQVAVEPGVVQVWKTSTCGCCSLWIEHMEAAGYTVQATDVDETMAALKAQHGIPGNLQSCHTALIDGYLIEGHVPAEDVARLLAERPPVKGLAVPGMPIGSPGMEVGDQVQPYDVVAFTDSGETEVFSSHGR